MHSGPCPRILAAIALAAIPLAAQSVVSTHSGVLYFFVGDVFLGDAPVQQQFGRFPDIEQGRELRTGVGRAEILLTPGVFLRIDQNTSIRMLSTSFADTRVELLRGSAILDATETTPGTAVAVMYQKWTIRLPKTGVCRIDAAATPHVRPYQGEALVSASAAGDPVPVHEGETLPLADVLLAEPANPGNDDFKYWAMMRSQAITADNTVAAGIVDDPGQGGSDPAALSASGGYTWFPSAGIPSAGIGDPYGLSFWSPFQSTLTAVYFQPYFYSPVYLVWGGRQGAPGRIVSSGGGRPAPYSPRIAYPRIGPPLIGSPRIGSPRIGMPRVDTPRVSTPRIATPVYRPAPLPSVRPIAGPASHR